MQKKSWAQTSTYVDSVYLVNGNILTGQFKNMLYGVLVYDMDGIGNISIEDIKINSIKSKKLFEVKLKEGKVLFGSFDSSAVAKSVQVITKDSTLLIAIADIVEIYPIKKNFWMRMGGDFGLGANYSKGSDVATLVISGNLYYRKKKTFFNLVFDDNNSFQADTLNTVKADVSFAWQRLLKKKWSAETSIGASQNSELGIKLREAFNLLMIRDIAYNNWNRFYTGAGLSFMQETPYGDNGIENSVAAILQLVWKVYKFTDPKVRVDANISYLPYFAADGRYRIILNLYPYISILNENMDVGLKFYYNYDSQPPISANSNFDYGINLQISYSFH
jgi:hypothetical protein